MLSSKVRKREYTMLQGYFEHLTWFDYFILFLGLVLFIVQIVFIVCHYYYRFQLVTQGGSFCCAIFAALCELFPLLGLLGTVLGILNTFDAISDDMEMSTEAMKKILGLFAPALTTTVSGIACMIPNLLVNVGYSIILQKEVKEK